MPLNEREQRILEEIERQFYEDDPKLAETVAKTTLESLSKKWQRLSAVGFGVGLLVMFIFFTQSTVIALVGFIVAVISGGWLAMNLRRLKGESRDLEGLSGWADRVRQRWRRDR